MNFYVSDLDGTLLNSKGYLSEYSKNTINSLINNGLNFTVASARSVNSIREKISDLNLTLPVIDFNGAFITDLKSGNHQIINSIGKDVRDEILADILRFNHKPCVSTYQNEDKVYMEEIINDGYKWYLDDRIKHSDKRLRRTDDLRSIKDDKFICFTIIDRMENLEKINNFLKEKYKDKIETNLLINYYQKGWDWLTIYDYKATKDRAIKQLCKEYGFDINKTFVFGDGHNDIKMLKAFKNSYVVENAIDIVKEAANTTIEKNDNDSVVKTIEKIEFQNYIYKNIPITEKMSFTIEKFEIEKVKIKAQLEKNINHKSTAFGGSISSLLIMSCWGYVFKLLKENGLKGEIVISKSEVDFYLPIKDNFVASCEKPEKIKIDRFLKLFEKKSKSRIELESEIIMNSKICAKFRGTFVAIKHN